MNGQNASLKVLYTILNLEKQITLELKDLIDLKIYPTSELFAIKKEIKVFKDFQENRLLNNGGNDVDKVQYEKNDHNMYDDLLSILLMEQQLCGKKLSIINMKNIEELNNKANIMKKKTKEKLIDVMQSKDPSNFKNQKKF
jgi:hypothetical protein